MRGTILCFLLIFHENLSLTNDQETLTRASHFRGSVRLCELLTATKPNCHLTPRAWLRNPGWNRYVRSWRMFPDLWMYSLRSRYWKEAGVRLLAGVEPDFKNKRQTSRTPVRQMKDSENNRKPKSRSKKRKTKSKQKATRVESRRNITPQMAHNFQNLFDGIHREMEAYPYQYLDPHFLYLEEFIILLCRVFCLG